MRLIPIWFSLAASIAVAQTQAPLYFAADNPKGWQELSNTIRTITDAKISIDAAQKRLLVGGTSPQIATAEWLFQQLDKPAAPDRAEYRILDGSGELVRVFKLAHADPPQKLQEIVNLIRTLLDTQRMFPYQEQKAIVLRGAENRVAPAEWLIGILDRPDPGGSSAAAASDGEYRLEFGPGWSPRPGMRITNDVMRVFHLKPEMTPQEVQGVVNLIRTTADLQRMFPYDGQRAIAVRGQPDQLALAEWLIAKLGVGAQPPQAKASDEYRLSWLGSEEVVRVYSLKHADSPKGITDITAAIRTQTKAGRVFPYGNAIALRGTPTQVLLADQLVKQFDDPNVPTPAR